MNNKILEVVEEYWGEDEEVCEALEYFFDNNEKYIIKIVEDDRTYNRYTCVESWLGLAREILDDEGLELDEDFKNLMQFALDNEDKDICRNILIEDNWALDAINGVAIAFDDDVLVHNHERI